MLNSFPLLILAAAGVAWAGGVHAQARAGQSAASGAFGAQGAAAGHALVLPRADGFDLRSPPSRSYAPVSARWKGDGSTTAVDYRAARGGAFGSAGFICLSDDPPGAPREVGMIAGSEDGRLLGASLSYPLR